ncbi:MAG: hypothetical protein AAFP99_05865 [Pseudomonadota bacterium]
MSENQLSPGGAQIWPNGRLREYITAAALALFFAVILHLRNEAPNLIAMKLLAIPPYLLAAKFIAMQLNTEAAKERWSSAYIELHTLMGVNFASMMTIFIWDSTKPVWLLILTFVFMALAFGGTMALMSGNSSKKQTH